MAPRYSATVLVVFCLALAACGKPDTDDAATPASMAVSLARAESRMIERSVIASGPVSAWEEMQLGVELSGVRVTALHVDVGQSRAQGPGAAGARSPHPGQRLAPRPQASLREADAARRAGAIQSQPRPGRWSKEQVDQRQRLDELRAGQVQARGARRHRAGRSATPRSCAAISPNCARRTTASFPSAWCSPARWSPPARELLRLIRQGRLEWRAELPEDRTWRGSRPAQRVTLTGATAPRSGPVRAVSPGVDSEHPHRHDLRGPARARRAAGRHLPGRPHRHRRGQCA